MSKAVLAERARDAWAVLRVVPPSMADDGLLAHGRLIEDGDEMGIGNRDGLADAMLEIACLLEEE